MGGAAWNLARDSRCLVPHLVGRTADVRRKASDMLRLLAHTGVRHMVRQTAFALLAVVALACAGWTAAFAQDKPTGYTRPSVDEPSSRPLAVAQKLDTPSLGIRTRRQCFWRDTHAGGF